MIKYQYQEINTFERSFSFLVLFHLGYNFFVKKKKKRSGKQELDFKAISVWTHYLALVVNIRS